MLPAGWAALPQSEIFAWGPWNSPSHLAHNLFTGLRDLDQRGVDVIVCPLPPPGGLNDAIRDRLRKAARPA
jgi:L-threonylcarbamoyladenylate synthase